MNNPVQFMLLKVAIYKVKKRSALREANWLTAEIGRESLWVYELTGPKQEVGCIVFRTPSKSNVVLLSSLMH